MEIIFHTLYDRKLSYAPKWLLEMPGEVNIYDEYNLGITTEKNPIVMLVEPRSIEPFAYDWVEVHHKEYKYVFTFDSRLLERCSNAKLMLYGAVNIFSDCPKTKMISMACSGKTSCEGHRERLRIARLLKSKIDVYGKFDGGMYVDYSDIFNDYKFHVAMENYSDGYYFTEKILNCFATKTVPIYYGCPHISEYFNSKGILQAKSPDDILGVVNTVLRDGDSIYESMRDAIEDNYKRAAKYERLEQPFFDMHSKLLGELK